MYSAVEQGNVLELANLEHIRLVQPLQELYASLNIAVDIDRLAQRWCPDTHHPRPIDS